MRRASLILALAATSIAAAPASAVVLSASALQSTDGELFDFDLGPAPANIGGGSFTITARGDYSVGFPTIEFLDLSVESLNFPGLAPANADSFTEFNFDDVQWTRTFALSASEVAALVANGSVDVIVNLSDNVANFFPGTDGVRVELSYDEAAVPAPAALALFGIGALALGLRRRA